MIAPRCAIRPWVYDQARSNRSCSGTAVPFFLRVGNTKTHALLVMAHGTCHWGLNKRNTRTVAHTREVSRTPSFGSSGIPQSQLRTCLCCFVWFISGGVHRVCRAKTTKNGPCSAKKHLTTKMAKHLTTTSIAIMSFELRETIVFVQKKPQPLSCSQVNHGEAPGVLRAK